MVLIQLAILVVLTGLLIWVAVMFVYALVNVAILLQGPFYAPSSEERIRRMLELAAIKPGMKVADLGSGDGRVVIAAAKAGADATGLEIDPWLVWKSRRAVHRAGVADHARILSQSFWLADMSQYEVIFLYVTEKPLHKLEKKLQRQLKPGAKVISVHFQFAHWPKTQTLQDVHLYVKS